MGGTWEVHGKYMGKVPQSKYTMGFGMPAIYLVYLVFYCQVIIL